jgi:hypothetical protein
LDVVHRQLVVVWDSLNAHISTAMAELIAAWAWLTVYQLLACAHRLQPVSRQVSGWRGWRVSRV